MSRCQPGRDVPRIPLSSFGGFHRSRPLMKRWLILAILVVALTAAGTLVLQTLPADSSTPGKIEYPAPLATEGPKPKVVVDGDLTHHFDNMAQESAGEK